MMNFRQACISMLVMFSVLTGFWSVSWAEEPKPDTRDLIALFDQEEREAVQLISGAQVYDAFRWQGGPLKGYVILTSGKESKRLDLSEETLTRARALWKPYEKEAGAFDPAKVSGKLLVVRREAPKGAVDEFVLILKVGYAIREGGVVSNSKNFPITPPGIGFGTIGEDSKSGVKRKWVPSALSKEKEQPDFFEFGVDKPETGKK